MAPADDRDLSDAELYQAYNGPNKSLLDDESGDDTSHESGPPPPPPSGPPPVTSFNHAKRGMDTDDGEDEEDDIEDQMFMEDPFEGEEIEPPPGNFAHLKEPQEEKPDDIIMGGKPGNSRKGVLVMLVCLLILIIVLVLGLALGGGDKSGDGTTKVSSAADDNGGTTDSPTAAWLDVTPTAGSPVAAATAAPAVTGTMSPTRTATMAPTATATLPPTRTITSPPTRTITSPPTATPATMPPTAAETAPPTPVATVAGTAADTLPATELATPAGCVDTIVVEESCVDFGNDIVISFENCEPRVDDWVGIYPDDPDIDPDNLGGSTLWLWTCGTQDCGGEVAADTLSFSYDADELDEGTYIAYLIRDDGEEPYPSYAISAPFEVTSAGCGSDDVATEPPTTPEEDCENMVMVDQSCYAVGEDIAVLFQNCDPEPDDWIGIYTEDPNRDLEDLGEQLDWLWTCGTQDCTGIAFVDTLPFGDGLEEGVYTAYLIGLPEGDDGPYAAYAQSESFVISSTGCP